MAISIVREETGKNTAGIPPIMKYTLWHGCAHYPFPHQLMLRSVRARSLSLWLGCTQASNIPHTFLGARLGPGP
jgi:hypothetical protein